mmetsp:Transcript_8718/g.24041  ORF Transcript_8718/g.24041 Transcript_8718/m.24041 type:complete len:164 (+) Transcript_8718:110-601(+)
MQPAAQRPALRRASAHVHAPYDQPGRRHQAASSTTHAATRTVTDLARQFTLRAAGLTAIGPQQAIGLLCGVPAQKSTRHATGHGVRPMRYVRGTVPNACDLPPRLGVAPVINNVVLRYECAAARGFIHVNDIAICHALSAADRPSTRPFARPSRPPCTKPRPR